MAIPNDVLTYENDTIVFIRSSTARRVYGVGACFIGTITLLLVVMEILRPDLTLNKLSSSPLQNLLVPVITISSFLITFIFLRGTMLFELRCNLKTGRYSLLSGYSFNRAHRSGTFEEFARLRLLCDRRTGIGQLYLDWKKWWKETSYLGYERDLGDAHRILYRVAADLHIPATGVKSYLKEHPEALDQPGKRPSSERRFDLLDHPDVPENHNVTMHVVDRSKDRD